MQDAAQSYHGYRFPPEIISHAVWLYHRFCFSFRDTEDLLAQRGIVCHVRDHPTLVSDLWPPYAIGSGIGAGGWAIPGIWTNCS